VQFDRLRSNPADPPDVLCQIGDAEIGIELTELAPVRRYEKDQILVSLRRQILADLEIGDGTRDTWIQIFFKNDYAEKLRPGRCGKQLAVLLAGFLGGPRTTGRLTIPEDLSSIIDSVTVRKADLEADPRPEP